MGTEASQVYSRELLESDPTWKRAFEVADARLQIPTNISQLLRNSWRETNTVDEFIRLAGFCQLNFDALIEYAGDEYKDEEDRVERLRSIVQDYGLRHAATLLGINYCCRMILATNPPGLWKTLFDDMILAINIGKILGQRVEDIGVESGMLVGFARAAGLSILMSTMASL